MTISSQYQPIWKEVALGSLLGFAYQFMLFEDQLVSLVTLITHHQSRTGNCKPESLEP
jgi:hypothetical protein